MGRRTGRFAAAAAIGAVGLAAASCASGRADPSSDPAFERWRAVAGEAARSPATAAPGDVDRAWTAPDGRSIHVVVRVPHPAASAPVVRIGPVQADADATPLLEHALDTVRRLRAGRLVVAPGTYVFRSLVPDGTAHVLVDGVSDLSVEGDGATFVFSRDATGVAIRHAHRVRLEGVTIRYALRTSSTGRIERVGDGPALVLDDRARPDPDERVTSIVEVSGGRFRHGGVRLMFPPDASDRPVLGDDGAYRSARFAKLAAGTEVVAYHQWYGGVAIEAGSGRGDDEAEDVTIDRVAIRSAPGMGVLAYGVRRGFAVTRSAIAPASGSAGPLSSEFDGIHVEASGGDVVLEGNLIAGTGDDGINLNAPVFPIERNDAAGAVLGAWSRFVAPGDPVAFFDRDDRFLGTDVVATVTALGGLRHAVTFRSAAAADDQVALMRDLALSGSRFVVSGNTIRDCNCHGILVQDPDGLVERNRFIDLDRNAIRLLTSTGIFKEGIGAFDVAVRENVIERTGPDQVPALPWAAITAYGVARPLRLADHPANADLLIEDNRISDADDGCVTVADTENAVVRDNRCVRTDLVRSGQAPIVTLGAANVRVENNGP